MNLGDLFTGKLSWRRLAVLVTHLPREAAVVRAQHGEQMDWGPTEHLLAAQVDLLAGGNWQRGGGKGQRPKPVKRPGQRRAGTTYERTTLAPDDVKALLRSFDPQPEGEPVHG